MRYNKEQERGHCLTDVFIVDDHYIVRASLKRLVEDIPGMKVVGEADSGEQAIQLVRKIKPDVILMDIGMPGIGGIEATRKILRGNPDIKILVITAYTNDIFPIRLLQAGASGYLTKDAGKEEMQQAIVAILAGHRAISPGIARRLALKSMSGESISVFDNLSERELQIVIIITQGIKVQEVAEKFHLSTKTINSYRYRIFKKLKIKSDVELTHLALQHGLIQKEDID